MKLIVVMICIVGLTGSYASVYSQQTKLNLNVQKTMVKDVLKLIEDQSEFSFMYNASKIDVNREVDVNVEKTSVEEILKKVFAGEDVTFTVIDRNIVITPKSAESSVAQQQKSVSGKVTDSSGGSLPGVSVVVKGTTKGVITDANGSYSLANIPANTLLQFSFVGMKMQEIMVGNKTTINVTLAEETVGIDEVVAVGYGTQKRGNLTGAVATISNDKIVKAPVGTTSNALAGQLPGLITKQSGGQPGMDAALLSIRGFGSPLIIVDGVEAEINNVDPNEIESISVLKDASAAIYGARAGNGVILISTKRGNEEKPTITLNSTYSFMGVTEFGKPVNAGQYAELILEANLNAGLPASSSRFQSEDVQKYFSGTDPGYPNANWWNVIMKEWTPEQQHSLSVRGGDKKIKYFGSLSFLNQDLMYKAGGNYYQRFNIRSNIDANITKDLSLQLDFVDIYEIRKYPNRSDYLVWEDLFNAEPVRYSSYPDPTKVPISGQQLMNPIVDTHRDIGGYRDNDGHSIKSTLALNYKIPYIDGLSFKAMVNYSQYFSLQKDFQTKALLYDWDYKSDTYRVAANTPSTRLSQTLDQSRNITSQISFNYQKVIASNHRLNAMLLYEFIDYRGEWINAQRQDFLTNSIEYLNAGGQSGQSANGSASETGRVSYVGRLNYAYKGKYLLESTFRYDASAQFAPAKRWGLFPSISTGWRLSEEAFIKNNIPWLSNLKLRGGFSNTGLDNVGGFQYLSGYNYGRNYLFGSGLQTGIASTGATNQDLTWEKMTLYNLGLDFALLKRMLYGEVDVFYRKLGGIPAYRYATLPSTFGESLPQENLNSQNNRGFEVKLGHSGSNKNFSWDISGNVSWSRAKWDHFEEPMYTDSNQIRINKKSGTWTDRVFGYKSDGLFTSQKEIDNLGFNQDLKGNKTIGPGDIRYVDINLDGVLDWKDQVELGAGDVPHWIYGMEIILKYKKFDFSTLFQGAMGSSVLVKLGTNSSVPQQYVYDDRWTPANNDRNAIVPRRGGAATNYLVSDYNLKPADYLRMKNLNIGYTFPAQMLSQINIKSLRIFFAGTNLFTIDKLKKFNLDPESAFQGNGLYYPQQRTFTMGINLSF